MNGRRRPKLAATPPFPGDSLALTSEAFEKMRGRFDQTSVPSLAPPPLPDTLLEVFFFPLWNFDSIHGYFCSLTSLGFVLQMKLTQLLIPSLMPSRVSLFEFGLCFAYKVFVKMSLRELVGFCDWVLLLMQHCKPGRLTVGNAFLLMGLL